MEYFFPGVSFESRGKLDKGEWNIICDFSYPSHTFSIPGIHTAVANTYQASIVGTDITNSDL